MKCVFLAENKRSVEMSADRRLWFTHKCRFCSYFFVCEKDLVCHEAAHDAVDFACDSCLCVFDDAEQLSVHVNDGCSAADVDSYTDIGRQHVCGTCGEIFRFVRELYKHYSERHMNDMSVSSGRKSDVVDSASVCANCGAIFSGSASLKVHLWKAHNLNVVQQPDHILKKNGRSTVTCRDSYATSTCRRLLLTDKEKPFKCSMCNWTFKYDFSFRAHLKMHEEKQRLLEEMLRANCECESESSVVDEMPVVDDTLVSNSGQSEVPIMLFPLKRKFENVNDEDCLSEAKSGVGFNVACSRSSCSTSSLDVDVDSAKLLVSEASSGQQSVDETSWTSVNVSRVPSQLMRRSRRVRNTSRSVVKQNVSVNEPLRFACKLCSFRCRYDFSYIAHLNQHDKLKQLEIDDLQSHLVASSSTQTSPNKFAIQVVGPETGDECCADGRAQVVDSSEVSYILLCSGAVDHTTLVSSLPAHQQYDGAIVAQSAVSADAIDCLNSNVVFVDDVNTCIEQDLDSAADNVGDVNFSVGPEMQFLDSTSGETLYVINETDLQVALPTDAAGEHQTNLVCEQAGTEVVLFPEPSDRQLLDDAGFCSDDDDDDDEDSYTCYYCNAAFTNKSRLQQHILRLHVE